MPGDEGVPDAGRIASFQPDRSGHRFIIVKKRTRCGGVRRLQKEMVTGLSNISDDAPVAIQTDVGGGVHTDEQRQAGLIKFESLFSADYFDQTVQIGSSQRRVKTIFPEPGRTLSVCRTSLKPLRLPVAV